MPEPNRHFSDLVTALASFCLGLKVDAVKVLGLMRGFRDSICDNGEWRFQVHLFRA